MTKPNLALLLANAPETVEKSDEHFDWDNAIVSQNLTELRAKIGRPVSDNPKQAVSIRLDSDIVDYFKATGKGWQTRLNNVLREWVATHQALSSV